MRTVATGILWRLVEAQEVVAAATVILATVSHEAPVKVRVLLARARVGAPMGVHGPLTRLGRAGHTPQLSTLGVARCRRQVMTRFTEHFDRIQPCLILIPTTMAAM